VNLPWCNLRPLPLILSHWSVDLS